MVLGVCLFASIALVSTGFAAWVLSANATKDNTNNINVGAVTDGQVEFGDVVWSTDAFRFDTKQNDSTGIFLLHQRLRQLLFAGEIRQILHDGNLVANLAQKQGFLECGVAAANHSYVLVCVESTVTDSAEGNAVAN